jgi:hypothetical protein
MSRAAKSVYYFGFYLLAAGLVLFISPNTLIALLGLQPTQDFWVYLVGALTFILGVFFFYMARSEIRPFFYISMFGRGIFALAIISAIIFYDAPVNLLLFAAIDLIGLTWTLYAYRAN